MFELNSSVGRDRLVIRPNAQEDGSWNLQAMTGDRHPPQFTDLLTTQTDEVSPDYLSMHSDGRYDFFDTFGTVPQLGSASQSHWSFYSGFWPAEGLLAFNKVTNEETRYSYETPFAQWNIRNAVHLPSDKVLFQLGGDRICAIDMESRRIAQLWAGRSPVAVMKRLPAFQNGRTSGSRPQAADPVSSSAKKTTKSF